MKRFKLSLTNNPTFNTVVGLSNTTFDPENYVPGRGATEDQIKFVHDMIADLQAWLDEHGCSDDPYAAIRQKIDDVEAAIDECCANPQDSLIAMLTARLDALEESIAQCCADYEAKVQELMDNLTYLPTEDCGNNRDVLQDCAGGSISVDYEFDISQETEVLDHGKIVGRAIATVNTPGKVIRNYYFAYDNKDGTRNNYASNIVRIEGHENITFQINGVYGYITMRTYQPAINGARFVDPRDNRIPDAVLGTGSGANMSKLYLEVVDTDNCRWLTELPLSAFDFSGIDGNTP